MKAIEDLKELAYRANYWTSFSPKERGEELIKEYSVDLSALLKEISDEHKEWVTEKYVRLLSAWLYAKSRCISSAITGASKFPTARANKYNNWERGHYNTFIEWRNSIAGKLKRKAEKANWTIEGEIHRLEYELENLKSKQERMKAANKIMQSKKLTADEKLDELHNIGFNNLESITGFGFYPLTLTNLLNKIKGRENRIAEFKRRLEAVNETQPESVINGIRAVENVADNRLQLFFEGVPSPETRGILKSNGYRWSPSNQCWQSYLSGKWKLQNVLDKITNVS